MVPVDLSGLIFVALALVWGVVLIPKALRAHDDAASTRSVDASSDDARVLPRGGRAPAQPTPSAPVARPDRASLVAQQRQRAAGAARRRRRVLALLVLASVATGVASATGPVAPWAAAVPGGLVLGFLVLARVLVRREHAAWARTVTRLRAAGEPAEPTGTTEAQDETPAATPEPELHVVARNDQGVAIVSDSEDTSTFDAATLAEAVGGPAGTLWDPLPVTLPTYVTKPRATRSVRTIDLQGPGVSSSGHDVADSALVADASPGGEGQEPPAQRAIGS